MTANGLSSSRLDDLHHALAQHVERRHLPGVAALVRCGDDTHVETIGTLSFESETSIDSDSIVRIASLTKLVVAVGAMMLVEECAIRLDDAIERWIPELADRRVLRSIDSPLDDTVPARRPITLRDLLTYRTGFGSVMAPPGTYPIQTSIRELRIGGDGFTIPSQIPTTEEWLHRFASLPLIAQPGERWLYHVSGDLLGLLISRVAGQPLVVFLRDRVFEPLGMSDTAFSVPPEKRSRLTDCYTVNPKTKALERLDSAATSAWGAEPPMESGGGGLVSTLDDFFSFCRMLLDRGRLGNTHVLSPASVDLMTSDQLTPANREGGEIFFGDYRSWGLGMAVDIRCNEIYRTPGRYGWDGGSGTSAYIDPVKGLIGILFTQRCMESPEPPAVFTDFWTKAYAAVE
jgi:CubicO group peptidase (beta-lactamase class C family)